MWDASFFSKLGINMMMMNYNSQPIVTMRAGDYMWNNTDPMFSMAGKIMPNLVPTTNLGILHIVSIPIVFFPPLVWRNNSHLMGLVTYDDTSFVASNIACSVICAQYIL